MPMCYLRPLKVDKLEKNIAILENGIKAYYDKKIGVIKPDDKVLVYGNLIIRKYEKTKPTV